MLLVLSVIASDKSCFVSGAYGLFLLGNANKLAAVWVHCRWLFLGSALLLCFCCSRFNYGLLYAGLHCDVILLAAQFAMLLNLCVLTYNLCVLICIGINQKLKFI